MKQKPKSRGEAKKVEQEAHGKAESVAQPQQESEPRVGGTVGSDEPLVTFIERKFTEDIANPMDDVGESHEQPLKKPTEQLPPAS